MLNTVLNRAIIVSIFALAIGFLFLPNACKKKSTTPEPSPTCSISPTHLAFGTVIIGGYYDLSFTITNIGGGMLNGTVSSACSQYKIISGEGTYNLSKNQSWSVTVRFVPSDTGHHSCTIETGNGCITDVSCSGEGWLSSCCLVSPETLNFGQVYRNNSIPPRHKKYLSFTITNCGMPNLSGVVNGNCPFRFSIYSGEGAYFLTPGEIHRVVVEFAPYDTGIHTCTIETGNPTCPDVICIGGGIYTCCSLDKGKLDFGEVPVNQSSSLSSTITNCGNTVINGTVTFDGVCQGFSIVSGGGSYSLSPGQSRIITISFTPTQSGLYFCSVNTGYPPCFFVICTGQGK